MSWSPKLPDVKDYHESVSITACLWPHNLRLGAGERQHEYRWPATPLISSGELHATGISALLTTVVFALVLYTLGFTSHSLPVAAVPSSVYFNGSDNWNGFLRHTNVCVTECVCVCMCVCVGVYVCVCVCKSFFPVATTQPWNGHNYIRR